MAKIAFVDKDDNVIGAGTRIEAKQKNLICRVAQIFVFNSKGQLLLQKRGPNVSVPNKWDDSAAGHVDEGEEYLAAAYRELAEELGVKDVKLIEILKYYTEMVETGSSTVGKRFNMLYSTTYDGNIIPNPSEIAEIKWMNILGIQKWIAERPDDFTMGFKTSFQKYSETRDG